MPAGFLDAFLRRAAREPEAAAIVLYGRESALTLTNIALKTAALRWATLFRARGARPGDVIILFMPLCADLIEGFLGALCAGCVPSVMPVPSGKQDPALFWSSHELLFKRLGGGLILTSSENAAAIAAHMRGAAMTVVTPADFVAGTAVAGGDESAIHPWRSSDIACLQHSSGTTGLKKGVTLSFDAIDAQLGAYTRALGIEARDTIVSWLPLYHDMGFVACLLLPLAMGVRSVMLDPFAWLVDPLSFLEAIERHAGTFGWLPNFAFAHLVNAAGEEPTSVDPRNGDGRRADLSSLRALIDCSEACRPDTLAAFQHRFAGWGLRPSCLRTCYAMAETVFAVTQSPEERPPPVMKVERAALDAGLVVPTGGGGEESVALVSSGVPLAGVELAILDPHGQPAAPDRVGQIAIKAPFLFGGYHLEPERTAAAFQDGFYLTGDLGFRMGEDLFVLGRRDDLLVLLGRNVFANEIEALLGDVPGVKPGRVLAIGLYDEDIGSQQLTVLAETSDDEVDKTVVRTAIRSRLESILGVTPRRIIFIEAGWLVKSTSGKISRGENRRKFLADRGTGDVRRGRSQSKEQ